MRMGCGPLTALPLMKIPESVELVGLVSLVSHPTWSACHSELCGPLENDLWWAWRCHAEAHVDKTPDLRDAVANLFRHLAKFCQIYILVSRA